MSRAKNKDFDYYASKKYDGMMGRCYRSSDKSFPNYGGRGIRVCSEWIKDISTFRLWLKEELYNNGISKEEFVNNSRNMQLDRVDTNGHYTPENCRIVSAQSNSRNRRCVTNYVFVSAEGEEIDIREN